ncbi:PepSY domain-containing protein [Sporosarcina sp. Sa2YVA2]|uniref:PepSY domain-containing protein n=1 Tax=Sporosarcina quadrami TaxID=2762234 RepID=A0ABR8UC67_9BACL|nr:PepSY domain-containing protein [Sporosarcina quadrami]MBD7985410.1 PepSY domain-containing protein [Sporosarcina quadrami]
MNKWMLIPAMAGVVAIGGVAMASDSVPSSQVSSKQVISLKEAKELAAKKVGGVVTEIELERKGSAYYYEVDAIAKGIEYELKVDAISREVIVVGKSTETKWTDKMITEEQAVAIAKGKVNAVVTDIELDNDDKRFYYDIELEDDKFEYEVIVNAITGEIIKFSKENLNDSTVVQKGEVMSQEKAVSIAQTKAKGTVKGIELEKDNGRMIYEVKLMDDEYKYEVELDAVTGEVLEFDKERYYKLAVDQPVKAEVKKQKENNPSLSVATSETEKAEKKAAKKTEQQRVKLTKDQVIAIAKQHASGVVTDFELDDGVYEIEMEDGDVEYELEIDAYTGKVLSLERDD